MNTLYLAECLLFDYILNFHSLQGAISDPPIYALKFCPVPGYTSILGIANEDGNIAFQDTEKVPPTFQNIDFLVG